MVSITEERRRLAGVGLVLKTRAEMGSGDGRYLNDRPVVEPAVAYFLHIAVIHLRDSAGRIKPLPVRWGQIERIGWSRFPATGFSYNGVVDYDGTLAEGQPWGRRGAHTVNNYQRSTCPTHGGSLTAPSWNNNVNARALVLPQNIGDPVTDAHVLGAARWSAGYALAGLARKDARWHGHRCVTNKDCPGAKAFARIDDIMDLYRTYLRTGLPGHEEDDMPAPKDWDAADWAAFDRHVAATVHNMQLGRRTVPTPDGGERDLTLSLALARTYDNTVALVTEPDEGS